MPESVNAIERRIAQLREQMRGTLDRTKLPALHDQIKEELAKLKALNEGG